MPRRTNTKQRLGHGMVHGQEAQIATPRAVLLIQRIQPCQPRRLRAVRDVIRMRDGHPLGHARGARAVVQRDGPCELLRGAQLRPRERRRFRRPRQQRAPVPHRPDVRAPALERRRLAVEREDGVARQPRAGGGFQARGQAALGAEQEARARVAELVGELPRDVGRVGAGEDPARHDDAHEDGREEQRVARIEQHAVAGLQAGFLKAERQPLRPEAVGGHG